jgi:hypothetical protein
LRLLNFDLHPIVIHLSQSLVILIPVLIIITKFFSTFQSEIVRDVLTFSVFVFPFTLFFAIVTGIIDGLTRFKTLATPLLRVKIIFSIIILILSISIFFLAPKQEYHLLALLMSLLALGAGVRLGLWGKKLINVILPGTYPQKKGSKENRSKEEAAV